jgi:hypothetical protein
MARQQRVVLARETIDAAAASPEVRRALREKAQRIAPRAQRLAYAAGAREFAEGIRVVEGTRPGTKSPKGIRRPFARVEARSADASDREHGNVGVNRQAILRRAMGA